MSRIEDGSNLKFEAIQVPGKTIEGSILDVTGVVFSEEKKTLRSGTEVWKKLEQANEQLI